MPNHEIDALLLQIRTVALELRRLEGDGLDGLVMPGGESTTMTLGIEREGLAERF